MLRLTSAVPAVRNATRHLHNKTDFFFEISTKCIVPQILKLLPMRLIFFDLVIRLITNKKYAFFCILYVRVLPENIILIYWIKNDYVLL